MEVRILITKRSFRQDIVLILFSTILMLGLSNVSTANDRLWAAAGSKGHFVMIRHALAPGFGDPPEFVIGDCSTQRNLDDEGRKQALKIGRLFKSKGFKKAKIYSSQWCRCRETASMLRLGDVIDLQALNSFFEREENEKPQMTALNDFLNRQTLEDGPLILVTHYVNIGALTGTYPESGGIVVVKRTNKNKYETVGEIKVEIN